jgi:putative DNA primase/helicase
MDNLKNQNSPATPLQGFDALESFIRAFLLCDDHQLTILTLWIANTWCFSRFHTIPYLDIRSPEPQCGKSVCLKLLELLACEPALVTAAAPSTLLRRLLEKRSLSELKKNISDFKKNMNNSDRPRFPMTFLIDDCHHSFGPSERQPIVALLNCGADVNARYSHGQEEYFVAGPKAFAGNTSLPASLASRCIPIVLHRRKFSDQLNRFFPDELLDPSNALKQWLKHWTDEISPRLQETRDKPIQLPPALTPRQQQCAEPLLRIANMIGGSWPARARAALMAAFGVAEYGNQVQVLRDIRDLFLLNHQPEKLPTRDLLSYLRNLEDRPWNRWGSNSRNHLSNLLRPFGIFSCDIKVDGASLKGYRLHDFQDAWERYAGPVAASRERENSVAASQLH